MDEAYIPMEEPTTDGTREVSAVAEHIPDPIALQHHALSPLWQLQLTVPCCQGVPITMEDGQPVLWLLHLFSGRRREGDCHFCLDAHGSCYFFTEVEAVSNYANSIYNRCKHDLWHL